MGQSLKGKKGGEERAKKGGGKAPETTLEKLRFWYPSDLESLSWPFNLSPH